MKAYSFGAGVVGKTMEIPAGNEERINKFRDMLLESVAETSDALLEKYLGGEEITRDEAVTAVHQGIRECTIAPVVCGSAANLCGIEPLMDLIVDTFPSPLFHKAETIISDDGTEKEAETSETGNTEIFVFKTIADPFVGKMSFFKVMNGELKSGMELRNLTTGVSEKFAHIYTICGKKQTETDTLCYGDIGMIAKLVNTNTNDTLSADPSGLRYKSIVYPKSFYQRSIVTTGKGDEDKIAQGIARLIEEDPTIKYENNAETKQMLISGQGDIHLDVVVSKLKSRFGVSIELGQPKVAYRETIKGRSDVQGKHKKQSGGHGQYGDVHIRFSRGETEALTFEVSVVGGTVPKNYYPAVEKGLLESMQKGILAGYPVVYLKADLYDGSYHPVDSSEMAFKIAASLAYKEGLVKANPILLEPIGKVCVWAPDAMIGDIMSAVTKRRGMSSRHDPHGKEGRTDTRSRKLRWRKMTDFLRFSPCHYSGRGAYKSNLSVMTRFRGGSDKDYCRRCRKQGTQKK